MQSDGHYGGAEGIETLAEYESLRAIGVRDMQGVLMTRPGFKEWLAPALPEAEMLGRSA